jgi:hypothetical protein
MAFITRARLYSVKELTLLEKSLRNAVVNAIPLDIGQGLT